MCKTDVLRFLYSKTHFAIFWLVTVWWFYTEFDGLRRPRWNSASFNPYHTNICGLQQLPLVRTKAIWLDKGWSYQHKLVLFLFVCLFLFCFDFVFHRCIEKWWHDIVLFCLFVCLFARLFHYVGSIDSWNI